MSPVSDMETGHDAARINLTFPRRAQAGTARVVVFCLLIAETAIAASRISVTLGCLD